jgi:hypothetical protein
MILLINPPSYTVPNDTRDIPLGLAYIASVLIEKSYRVDCLDLQDKSFEE